MSPLLKAFGTASLATVTTFSYFSYWINKQTKELSNEAKGDLLTRMKEVCRAFMTTTDEISHLHAQTVATLPTTEWIRSRQNELHEEKRYLSSNFKKGYLYYLLERNPFYDQMPVFIYFNRLKAMSNISDFPQQLNHSEEPFGFMYAGNISNLFSTTARNNIIKGNYTVCDFLLENMDYSGKSVKKKALIASRTANCSQFIETILNDVVQVTGKENSYLNRQNPYSQTPVYKVTKDNIIRSGNLETVSESEKDKETIRNNDYTICQMTRYDFQREKLKKRNAIVLHPGESRNDYCCIEEVFTE